MVDETEQKFLDAALEIFAEKGYKGATTRLIAKNAGFSELTLFRKFKTKENLFNKVLNQNIVKVKEDVDEALAANVSKEPDVFLRTLITDMARIAKDHYEFISLSNTQKSGNTDPMLAEFVKYMSKYLEENLPGREVDYNAMALSLYSYTFMISQTKHHNQDWFNYDQALEGFIKNVIKLFNAETLP
ncbi:MAG: TetR/AcrR family transcriptional regulator [Methanobacterium sp.]|nr:TetR/AcrR family transcriptional regulator [Methanobacterium sp.]